MKVVYTGVHDAVEVSDGEGRVYRCERAQPVDLPTDLAKDLTQQSSWELAPDQSRPRKRTE